MKIQFTLFDIVAVFCVLVSIYFVSIDAVPGLFFSIFIGLMANRLAGVDQVSKNDD